MARINRSKYYYRLKLSHRNLHDLFALHQEALTHLKFDAALKYFEDYASEQFAHMEEEENSIFPFYKEEMNDPGFPGVEVFFKEHKKISEAFVLARVLLHKWIKNRGGDKNARSLKKAEASFMKLMKAHEAKEEKYFFPKIEKILDEKT